MKPIYEVLITGILLTIMVVSSYYLGTTNFIKFNIPLSYSYKENQTDCNSSILSKNAECLRNELNTFFEYNLSNINENNFTIIKQSGGVCWQYSNWIKDNLLNLGFNSKTIEIYGNDIGHQITISWTKNLSNGEYCINDMLNVECTKLGEINITEYEELTQ